MVKIIIVHHHLGEYSWNLFHPHGSQANPRMWRLRRFSCEINICTFKDSIEDKEKNMFGKVMAFSAIVLEISTM